MVLAVLVLLPGPVKAAEFDVSKFDQEVGLRFGYGKNTHGASVNIYSLLPRWGMFLKAPGKEWGPFGASFVIEGIISVASAEEVGFRTGLHSHGEIYLPHLSLGYGLYRRGAGMITESIDSPAIAHAFNFTPQFGGGFDIALTPNWPCRWRTGSVIHPTPASIKKTKPLTSILARPA